MALEAREAPARLEDLSGKTAHRVCGAHCVTDAQHAPTRLGKSLPEDFEFLKPSIINVFPTCSRFRGCHIRNEGVGAGATGFPLLPVRALERRVIVKKEGPTSPTGLKGKMGVI